MSIASGHRAEWAAIIKAADDTQGQSDDERFAAAYQAATEVKVKLITFAEYDALLARASKRVPELPEK